MSEPIAQAHFFDGATGARHVVALRFGQALDLVSSDGEVIDRWELTAVRRADSPENILRLSNIDRPELARLELRDPAAMALVERLCVNLDQGRREAGKGHGKLAFWLIAATISLSLVAIFGIPAIAVRLAPLVPFAVEAKIGDAVDRQIRTILKGQDRQAFSCETRREHAAAQAVLDHMVAELVRRAGIDGVGPSIKITVVHMPQANAIALPGGRIYVFSPLLSELEDPDQLAGILAHEIGHVVNRDGLRRVFEAAGLSFVFGTFLGDFGGGAILIAATRLLADAAFSRDVEQGADDFAAEAMGRSGRDPAALADALEAIAPDDGSGLSAYLTSHPLTKERSARLRQKAKEATSAPLISTQDWALLQRYCVDADD